MRHFVVRGVGRRVLGAWIALLAGAFVAIPAAADDDRDCAGQRSLRLVNGRIHTMDKKDTVVSSVLMRDGRFVEVGGGGDDRCTRTINLRGRTAVPGIIDNHNHIILLGLRPGHDTRLENANSIREALHTLKARAARVPAGEWITSIGGFSRNQFVLADGAARFPTLQELDNAVPNHPVLVFEGFVGPAQTNTLGKAFFTSRGIAVGADGSIAASPFGATGPSTQALTELRKLQTFDEQKRGLRDAMAYAAGVGVTTHLDQGGFPFKDSGFDATDGAASFDRYRAHDSVQALYQEGKLTNRIWINFLYVETDPATPELAARLRNAFPDFGDEMLRILGIGEFTGGPFFAPGVPAWQNGTRLVANAGWRNENHSLTASDFKTIIDGWATVNGELVAAGNPDGIRKLRWVLAHVPFITPEYVQKLKELGGGVNVLGGWRWLTGDSANNGPPFRMIRDSGIHMGMSSDGMQISTMNPWINLYYVVTGKNAKGELINAGQTLSRAEGLRLYTAENGWFLNAEDRIGTIEKGKYADLIVLNEDYFDRREVPDEKIKDVHSVLTIVHGRVVHDDLDGRKGKYWHRGWRREHGVGW